ncbi:hypothetical protein IMSHALPRED_004265 [Imshaugia aleurites]|uniref:Uncharacterized protein n=1 Tax=Imshaugia aleurites TaxID=172621 RepID=A0A8H3FCG5_9LECA|nr:hypothetical protein IMSHALPRED_004265 [Imshaugia aleurites]
MTPTNNCFRAGKQSIPNGRKALVMITNLRCCRFKIWPLNYAAKGEWEAVREIHRRMLSRKEKTLGADDPSTKMTREALASIEQTLGCYKTEANGKKNTPGFDVNKIYANWEKSLGPGHDVTKKSMRNRIATVKYLERNRGSEDSKTIKAKEALRSAMRRSEAEQRAERGSGS